MLSVDEALALVVQQARRLPAATVALDAALGRSLAEDIVSDIDSPPHDKSIVDGYAIVAADLEQGEAELEVIEQVTAGEVPRKAISLGQATRIMTGAPLPVGANAVVMIERSELVGQRGLDPLAGSTALARVWLRDRPAKPGQNILRQAAALRKGDVVLRAGCLLQPAQIGLLAETGRGQVLVTPQARVAVLATGNELVAHAQMPGPGQIRNSNGPMLRALVARAGATSIDLGIGRDNHQELQRLITRGLSADVLVVCGGVSAGVLDLAPGVFKALGVVEVFHKVRLKPGKPLWFGVLARGEGSRCLVFGLPGNPVSSFVCFELFVRAAIDRLGGQEVPDRTVVARLNCEFTHRGDRPTYHPARLLGKQNELSVTPLSWRGSADLRTLAEANSLILFAAGDRTYAPGEQATVMPI